MEDHISFLKSFMLEILYFVILRFTYHTNLKYEQV